MKLGVTLPIKEIGVGEVREYVQTAEQLGFDFVMVYDQMLAFASPEIEIEAGEWHREAVEPLVLVAHLAAATERVEFLTSVIVAPQRPTVLLAKQAADVATLSNGRLILGLGVGANPAMYRALGQDFHTRGRRFEEQIAVMRALWSQPKVTFHGEFHYLEGVSLDPRPPGGAVPIWIGTYAQRTWRRIGRLGDGWVGAGRSPSRLPERRTIVDEAAREAGRDPADIAIHMQVDVAGTDVEQQVAHARRCDEAGATHLSFSSVDAGMSSSAQHIKAMRAFIEGTRQANR